jgi:hypothetical protein
MEDGGPAMIEPTYSSRGFKYMDPIPSAYGGHVAVYESSAASGPHLWVAVKQDRAARLDGRDTEATAHLTLDDATRLRDQLTYLIENHYQVSDK